MKKTLTILLLFTVYSSYGQWVKLDIPTTNVLTGVDFRDEDTGFTCGQNQIFKTINGGQNWTLSFQGGSLFQFEDVKTFGNNVVIAVGVNFNTGQSLIVRSDNGGNSWVQISTAGTAFLNNVFFVDATTGFCCGNGGVILKSTDAGIHWTALNSGINSLLQAIFFINDQTGFVAGGAPESAKLLKTIDGGATWIPVPIATSSYLQALYFADPQTGYLVGWEGGIFKTIDGGSTWMAQNSVNLQGNLDVVFTDAQTGYVVGGSFIWVLSRKPSMAARYGPKSVLPFRPAWSAFAFLLPKPVIAWESMGRC